LSYPLRANMALRQRIEPTLLLDQSKACRKIIGKCFFAKRNAQGVSWFKRQVLTFAVLLW
jgi:hypothetical protein